MEGKTVHMQKGLSCLEAGMPFLQGSEVPIAMRSESSSALSCGHPGM